MELLAQRPGCQSWLEPPLDLPGDAHPRTPRPAHPRSTTHTHTLSLAAREPLSSLRAAGPAAGGGLSCIPTGAFAWETEASRQGGLGPLKGGGAGRAIGLAERIPATRGGTGRECNKEKRPQRAGLELPWLPSRRDTRVEILMEGSLTSFAWENRLEQLRFGSSEQRRGVHDVAVGK